MYKTHTFFPYFEISKKDIFLDVGCGLGEACLLAASIRADVIAIDTIPENIKQLEIKMKKIKSVSFKAIVSECNPIPLSTNTATAVMAQEVLEHVESPESFLMELNRVGKEDAKYLITVPDPASEEIMKIVSKPAYFQKPNHLHIFSHQDMEKFFKNTGFKILWKGYVGFFWSLWWIFHQALEGGEDLNNPTIPPKNLADSPLLPDWERTYEEFRKTKHFLKVESELDKLIPKSQVYVLRKL